MVRNPNIDTLTMALIDLLIEAVNTIDDADHGHIDRENLPNVYRAVTTAEAACQTWAASLRSHVEKRSEKQ